MHWTSWPRQAVLWHPGGQPVRSFQAVCATQLPALPPGLQSAAAQLLLMHLFDRTSSLLACALQGPQAVERTVLAAFADYLDCPEVATQAIAFHAVDWPSEQCAP